MGKANGNSCMALREGEEEALHNWLKRGDFGNVAPADLLSDSGSIVEQLEQAEGTVRGARGRYCGMVLRLGGLLLADEDAMRSFRKKCEKGGVRFDRGASVYSAITRFMRRDSKANAFNIDCVCREAVMKNLSYRELEAGIVSGSLTMTKMVAEFRDRRAADQRQKSERDESDVTDSRDADDSSDKKRNRKSGVEKYEEALPPDLMVRREAGLLHLMLPMGPNVEEKVERYFGRDGVVTMKVRAQGSLDLELFNIGWQPCDSAGDSDRRGERQDTTDRNHRSRQARIRSPRRSTRRQHRR